MTNKYKNASEDAVSAAVAIRDKLVPAPNVGAHVGGGQHVGMPPSWDGIGRLPPGWTGYDGTYSDGAEFACELPKELLQAADKSSLTEPEIATLNAALSNTPDLVQAAVP